MQPGHTLHTWHVDGLALAARDYPLQVAAHGLPVVCLHGLTRNSKDFDALARRLTGQGHRVVVPDIRGRGRSAHDPEPMRYLPQTYVSDVAALLDGLGIERAIFIGTSMGGIVTMGLAALRTSLVAAAVLNDVGPEVAPEGLARIAAYAGKPARIDDWDDAREYVRQIAGVVFPRFGDDDWMAYARLTFRENAAGKPRLDYDPAIAEPIRADRLKADPALAWALFEALCRDRPVLLLRGALSDLVSTQIAAKMRARAPTLEVAEVPDVGHAPLLDEPAAIAALDDFLQGTDDIA